MSLLGFKKDNKLIISVEMHSLHLHLKTGYLNLLALCFLKDFTHKQHAVQSFGNALHDPISEISIIKLELLIQGSFNFNPI